MSASHTGHVLISSWGRTEGEGTSSSQQGTGHWGFLGDDSDSTLQGASGVPSARMSGSQQKGRRLGSGGASTAATVIDSQGPLPPRAAAAQAAASRRSTLVAAEGSLGSPSLVGHLEGTLFQSHAASQHPDGPDLRSFEHQDSLTDLAEAAVRRLEEVSDGEPMAVSG